MENLMKILSLDFWNVRFQNGTTYRMLIIKWLK